MALEIPEDQGLAAGLGRVQQVLHERGYSPNILADVKAAATPLNGCHLARPLSGEELSATRAAITAVIAEGHPAAERLGGLAVVLDGAHPWPAGA